MSSHQDAYDEAMYAFSRGEADDAIVRLRQILAEDPTFFDAQLALGGAYFAKGDYAAAIAEGHRAETLRPTDQLVYTNLSRAYMKAGDKTKAEHYGLQARIASWRGNMAPPPAGGAGSDADHSALKMAAPPPPPAPLKVPEKFPDMPWKKKSPKPAAESVPAPSSTPDDGNA